MLEDAKKEKIEKMKKETEILFEPQINKITKMIIESDPNRAEEGSDEKIDRLAKKVIFFYFFNFASIEFFLKRILKKEK